MTTECLSHDSDAWRELRDRKLHGWVCDENAVRWLLDYYDVCELFDDLMDRDKSVTDDRIERALFEALIDMPSNPFFRAHVVTLVPVVHAGVNAWLDSVDMERAATDESDEALRLAYVMRAAYMCVTQTVIELTRGRDVMRALSREVVAFFGTETFAEYATKILASKHVSEV